ncbi:MAG: LysR family transcriptional regulator [Pseudomonadota bacterium]
MTDKGLDAAAVRAFLRVAESGGFTRAAESLDTTQSAVSLRIKRLEARLGRRLLERTPRSVRLSREGEAFLPKARAFVEAHDRALVEVGSRRRRVLLGVSDHVAGPELPALVARLNAGDPEVEIALRLGSSWDLLRAFDGRELDAALLRFEAGREDGTVIAEERFRWFASADWRAPADAPLSVATMPEPCGVRTLSARLLDDAGIEWTEVFVGGGVAAVAQAVTAGLGVAAMARRMLPLGAVDVGPALGLPELPRLPIVLHSRARCDPARRAVAALSAAYAGAARDRGG